MHIAPLGPVAGAYYLDNSRVAVIEGPVGCVSGDTEYLSPSGWVPIRDYDGGQVAIWSNGILGFDVPTDYIDEPCLAPMLRFSTCHSLSMVLTGNHRVPVYDWRGRFCVRTAERLHRKPSRHTIPINFNRPVAGMPLTENEIRLRVMIAADGCYPEAGKQCLISVRKERKKERIRALLGANGISYSEKSTNARRPTETNFAFPRPAFHKGLTADWFLASSAQLEILLDEISYWDGLFEGEDWRFSTSKKIEADVVQYAAHATGRRATISTYRHEDSSWATQYVVHIADGIKAKVDIRDWVRRDFVEERRQYCFTTSSGFWLARHRGRIFVTGNSGKTTASCLRLQRHAYEQAPGPDGVGRTRWAIVRNTKPQLKDTTIKTWLEVFPEAEYGRFYTGDDLHQTWEFKPKGHPWPIRAEFIFRALDDAADVANLLSLEVSGFYFNEVREIDEEILSHAGRRTRYLSGDRPSTWMGWIGDTNPWDTDHHLEDKLVTHPREGWAHFRQPGGMEPDAENLENLEQTEKTILLPFDDPRRREQGRLYYVKALQDYSPEDARVYVHAKRGLTRSGKPIYTEYNDIVHCRPFELDRKLPLDLGFDFGRTPACTIGQKDVRGRTRVRYEVIGERDANSTGIGIKPFGKEVLKFINKRLPGFEIGTVTGDPAGEQTDTSDNTAFKLLAAAGIIARAARTNELSVRIEVVQDGFRTLIDGEPALLIHPDCKKLRRACLDGYHYRKLQVAGNRYDDKPNKNEFSHVAEALQYELLGTGEGRRVVRSKGARKGELRVENDYSALS